MRPKIDYGLVYEGTQDSGSIDAFIKRLGDAHGVDFIPHPNPDARKISTATYVAIKTHAKLLFEDIGVSVAFIFADQDGNDKKKRGDMHTKLMAYNASVAEKTFLAISEPHLEQWLITDQNLIKDYFELPRDQTIPNPSYKAKDRLQHLTTIKGELFGDAKANLASRLDFEVVKATDNNFNHLCSDVAAYCSRLPKTASHK